MSMNKRVGVVGLFASGKTSFLTSLINHLEEHDSTLCPLKSGRRVEGFQREEVHRAFKLFEYERHRQFLVERHEWPKKTTDVSEFRCRFKLAEKRRRIRVNLAILDVPGERLADFDMATRSYDEWSDNVLRFLDIRPEYRVHAKQYMQVQTDGSSSAASLVGGYKRLLATLILEYKPLVAPSTFLVAPDGTYPPPEARTVQRLAEIRHSGLDDDREFAPLTREVREKKAEIANAFRKAYDQYRRDIVRPIVDWLSNANVLLVFVDVTTLLAGGLGMYEGNKEILKNLVKAIGPGASRFGNFGRWLLRNITFGGLDRRAVEQLALVATKGDKVLKDDRQRMHGLLRSMTRKQVDGIDGLKAEWFVCSAIDSTEDIGDGRLEGYLNKGAKRSSGGRPAVFVPSRVPDDWPEVWEPGAYSFPDVWPVIPPRRDAPPKHFQLHRILDFILDS